MTLYFLIYLLKVALSILLLMLLFKVILSTDKTLLRNRFYLVGAIAWSLSIPLINLGSEATSTNIIPAVVISPNYLINIPELVITPEGIQDSSPLGGNPLAILLTIYLTGFSIFFLRLVGSYLKITHILLTAKKTVVNNHPIMVTGATVAPFAFFGWIVFPKTLLNHKDFSKMLIHERVHSRQLHSLDLLLGEFFNVFQWFNPASWMLKRLMVENHEYTADKAVLDNGVDSYEYQASIVNAIVGRDVVPVNHFSLILIKKRIKMMNKKTKSGRFTLKGLVVPAAFICALALTSFTVEVGVNKITDQSVEPTLRAPVAIVQDNSTATEASSMQDDKVYQKVDTYPLFNGKNAAVSFREYIGKNLKFPSNIVSKDKRSNIYVQFIVEKDGSVSNVKILKGLDKTVDDQLVDLVKNSRGWTAGVRNGEKVRVSYTLPVNFSIEKKVNEEDESEVFFIAEEMPTFNGKEASLGFREYVAANLKYPEEAIKKNIQGNVYVQFNVNKDGTVSDVKVSRGVDPTLNEEALRIVRNSPNWEPGKQRGKNVKVSFTFPIKFQLDKNSLIPTSNFKNTLIFVNGVEFKGDLNDIKVGTVDNITIKKDKATLDTYGGKYTGIIYLTVIEGTENSNVLETIKVLKYE